MHIFSLEAVHLELLESRQKSALDSWSRAGGKMIVLIDRQLSFFYFFLLVS